MRERPGKGQKEKIRGGMEHSTHMPRACRLTNGRGACVHRIEKLKSIMNVARSDTWWDQEHLASKWATCPPGDGLPHLAHMAIKQWLSVNVIEMQEIQATIPRTMHAFIDNRRTNSPRG